MSDFELSDFELSGVETGEATGLDAFFASEPEIITPMDEAKVAASPPPAAPKRRKIGSLQQLAGYERVASDTLIHKSTQDLWAIKRDGEDYYIERLFQDGDPLKG